MNNEPLKTKIQIGIFTFKSERSELLIKELKEGYSNEGIFF